MKISNVQRKSLKLQRGNMVLQAAVAIGIGAIMILGAMQGFEYYQDAKVGTEIDELSGLKNKTVKYGQSLGGAFATANISTATLAGLNFWPTKMVSGTGASTVVRNQWGGTVTTAVGTAKNAGDAINYTYTGYSNYACKETARAASNLAAIIQVNATTVKALGANVDMAAVTTQCDAMGDNATIIYTISR